MTFASPLGLTRFDRHLGGDALKPTAHMNKTKNHEHQETRTTTVHATIEPKRYDESFMDILKQKNLISYIYHRERYELTEAGRQAVMELKLL